MTKFTKAQQAARRRLVRYLCDDHTFANLSRELRTKVPEAWHTLERDLQVEEPKMKVTLWLDTSVVKMFRAMGRGYQARMNRVLATWCQMRIAELLDEEETLERLLTQPQPLKERLGPFDPYGLDKTIVKDDEDEAPEEAED